MNWTVLTHFLAHTGAIFSINAAMINEKTSISLLLIKMAFDSTSSYSSHKMPLRPEISTTFILYHALLKDFFLHIEANGLVFLIRAVLTVHISYII